MERNNYMSNSLMRQQGQGNIIGPYNAGKSNADLLAYYQSLQPNLSAEDFMGYADRGGFNPERLAAMPGNDGPIGNPNMTAGQIARDSVGDNMRESKMAEGDTFYNSADPAFEQENDARRRALEWVINSEALKSGHNIPQFTGGMPSDPNQINDMRLQALLSLAREKGGMR
jgi:hypothetical protein